MAGTDEGAVAAEDDALYVLTAVLLTPAQFPSVLGDDYPEACAALGLAPLADGYGLVLGQDGEGARWTVVIDDVSLVAVAIASWDCGMEYDLSPDERTVVAGLPGWPLAVAVAAPGVPAPHDPDPEVADRPPLAPPDTTVWGPAQRRLGADEIALQWATWRDQIDDADFPSPNGGPSGTPADDASSEATGGAEDTEKNGRKGHGGIRRVLAEARAYVDAPPPLGRVRSSFAPGDARTLRADGPGWSLVARTDDIAFVLLDDEPGEVLPVGRGPELPGLLEALDKMAVRPI
ncbi:membrane protein [Streptomyces sp. MMG1533]|uniref:hypothetical protein n=1 Tax=Streptomyces sp. MMG1533 TaxID=1415546 RepID=UPI0006AE28C8|nr:hypothetical protein [Streptomyces sp. MMG1533]KOU63523.1 membrane protein [Streptomyces sp. MMG1533]